MIDYTKFSKSLKHLEKQFINYTQLDTTLSQITQEAVAESCIQRFEICYDCLWKVLKKYIEEELGLPNVPNSPKPLFRIAAENTLCVPIENWLSYADTRISTSHDYSGEKASEALELLSDFIHDAKTLLFAMTKK